VNLTTSYARVRAVSAFAGVGAIGIAVNQAVLTVLVHTGRTGYLLAAVVATQAAILVNFVMLERWVFRAGNGELARRLGRYWTVSNAFLVVGLPLLALLVSTFGVQYGVANLAVIGAQFALRYVVSERLIWRRPELVASAV
jgi:dolichol-phosphate mannosyltransferase